MKRYVAQELNRFLLAIDDALLKPITVIVIGGSAATIAYGVDYATQDIDTWNKIQNELQIAIERASTATNLHIPVTQSAIADAPYDFETRLIRVLPELKRLVVLVPEQHDLVLMKIVRCYEHDLQTIEAIHQRNPLYLSVLLERYENEMGAAIIDPKRLLTNFLVMVERIFPQELPKVEQRLLK
ncbi:MAG: hypothetical protein JW841_02775 [Deltaproteobacteria bacterium]|nr:hypothetical protein [Deltaproteobacteria bacterium]